MLRNELAVGVTLELAIELSPGKFARLDYTCKITSSLTGVLHPNLQNYEVKVLNRVV